MTGTTELANSSDPSDLRCSTWARAQQLDPIGSVGSYEGYLLVAWPLPWPKDISEIPELTDVAVIARAAKLRMQGLVCQSNSEGRTVILYRRPGDGDAGGAFVRTSWIGGADDVAKAAMALVSRSDDLTGDDRSPGDLLICSHGSRDRCCGSRGTALAVEAVDDGISGGRTIWRTSHTGGHRFAPTAIVLPEATAWAYLDAAILGSIARREGSVETIIDHYRGYAGLDSPGAQAIEREILREIGWDLFDMRRWSDTEGEAIRVSVRTSSTGVAVWEGAVGTKRELTAPDCGRPLEVATKKERELDVLRFERVL